MACHQPHIVTQTGPKNGIGQVSRGLIQIANGVPLRHRTMPETPKLRKDEPHPVGPLTSSGQFLNDLAVDRGLSVHEVEKISLSHRCCYSPSKGKKRDRELRV